MSGHWCHLEYREPHVGQPEAAPPIWRRVTRAVCQCGWCSPWYFAGAVAVEAGLTHSADPAQRS